MRPLEVLIVKIVARGVSRLEQLHVTAALPTIVLLTDLAVQVDQVAHLTL